MQLYAEATATYALENKMLSKQSIQVAHKLFENTPDSVHISSLHAQILMFY